MAKTCVDTSWLISLGDKSRSGHTVANEYLQFCVSNGHTLCLPTIVIAEFSIKANPAIIPLQYFRVLPLNYEDATRAARYQALIWDKMPMLDEPRRIVQNDLYIIAQANEDGCATILTEDGTTMTKWASRLKESGDSTVTPLLLSDGFSPNRLAHPEQYLL